MASNWILSGFNHMVRVFQNNICCGRVFLMDKDAFFLYQQFWKVSPLDKKEGANLWAKYLIKRSKLERGTQASSGSWYRQKWETCEHTVPSWFPEYVLQTPWKCMTWVVIIELTHQCLGANDMPQVNTRNPNKLALLYFYKFQIIRLISKHMD